MFAPLWRVVVLQEVKGEGVLWVRLSCSLTLLAEL
jgi:hypothetical protein